MACDIQRRRSLNHELFVWEIISPTPYIQANVQKYEITIITQIKFLAYVNLAARRHDYSVSISKYANVHSCHSMNLSRTQMARITVPEEQLSSSKWLFKMATQRWRQWHSRWYELPEVQPADGHFAWHIWTQLKAAWTKQSQKREDHEGNEIKRLALFILSLALDPGLYYLQLSDVSKGLGSRLHSRKKRTSNLFESACWGLWNLQEGLIEICYSTTSILLREKRMDKPPGNKRATN